MQSHNFNKKLVKYHGGSHYEFKDCQKQTISGFIRINLFLGSLMGLCAYIGLLTGQPTTELISPNPSVRFISPNVAEYVVEASESAKIDVLECDKGDDVRNYICEVFGSNYETAVKIAECESNLDPSRIGDTDLLMWDEKHQESKGQSVGLFQIRVGGNGWNRARANGMSVVEFEEYLLDYRNNVEYAKEIFNRQGWSPWTCSQWL